MTEEDAQYDQWMTDLYLEHSKEALEEFTVERLQSYYLEDPFLAKGAAQSLKESRVLLAEHPTASLVFATIAIEVGTKVVLLKPIVYGLVHDASAAGLITDLAIGHTGERYRDLLFHVLSKFGGVDLRTFARAGCKTLLWQEVGIVQGRRNAVVHRAECVSNEEAEHSVAVASAILEEVFPSIATKLGFHLHDGTRVCKDWECKYAGAFNRGT